MRALVFTALDGSAIIVDPEIVESVRASPDGIHIRMLDGALRTVRERYLTVLEKLAGYE